MASARPVPPRPAKTLAERVGQAADGALDRPQDPADAAADSRVRARVPASRVPCAASTVRPGQ